MTRLKIKYGKEYVVVDVENSFALAFSEMEKNERLIDRKETRRHQSLDKSLEHGFDIEDRLTDVAGDVAARDEMIRLKDAVSRLSPEQRQIVKLIFADGMSETELARMLGVSRQAVCGRLKRIYIRLRKNLTK